MDWDRVNFGRVLRELRTQASLSQADLAERIGRDRRRLMALEQATAVREPKPGEIALLATGLGAPDALDRLRAAVGTKEARGTELHQTIRDTMRADFAGDLSRLLAKLDEVRELARAFSRPEKDFLDAHITPGQLFRAGRGLANVCLKLHCELLSQAQELLDELKHDNGSAIETSGKRPRAPETILAFRERQLRYWNRCDWASARGQLNPNETPDAIEQLVDLLEAAVFHPHVMVAAIAESAIAMLGHLSLIWAGLALQVEPVRRPSSPTSRAQIQEWNRGEAGRQHVALTHLIYALEKFLELPIYRWASVMMDEDWADHLVDNLNLVGYVWSNGEGMADSIITECFDRLNLPDPDIKFSPFAAQSNRTAPSHASSHATSQNDAQGVQTTPRRKPKLSSK